MRLRSSRRELVPDLMLLAAAIIWGGGFVACALAVEGFSPINILMFRFCGAAVVCGLVFFRRLRRITRREVLFGACLGALQVAGLLLQVSALHYTTPAKQSFLVSGYIVLTPFLSWLILRRRPALRDLAAAFVALAGLACISLTGSLSVEKGDYMTLGFAAIFGLQIVLTGLFGRTGADVLNMTFCQFAFAGLLSLAASLAVGIDTSGATVSSVLGVVYLAVINTAVAMCLQNYAQKRARDSHAALLLSLESLFGLFFSVLWFHERLTARMLLGCGLVFSAVLLSSLPKKHKEGSAPGSAQQRSC